MKRHAFFTLLLVSALTAPLSADNVKAKAPKAPNPALAPIQDKPGLPRVLIIGDSISIGYTLPTRALLESKANVHRIPQNGGPTTNGLANLDKWLGEGPWKVIHFNWGLHDLKFMPEGHRQVEKEAYEKNLRTLVSRMKATGAHLIWATTTPVPEGELNPPRKFGDVADYNAIAERVMKENAVEINDLNAWVTPKLKELQKPNDVHFHNAGSDYLGQRVAEVIEAALKR